jgi:uncharacterized membrane protein
MEKLTVSSVFMKGLYFVVPTFLFVFIISTMFSFLRDALQPFVNLLPGGTVLGMNYPNIVIFILLILLIFAAGYAGIRTGFGDRFVSRIETLVPGYMLLKHLLSEKTGEGGTDLKPCLALIDDGWLFSFIVEEMDNGMLVVFVPGAPSITSGNVYIMNAETVKRLDISKKEAVKSIMQFGIGTNERLKGKVDW